MPSATTVRRAYTQSRPHPRLRSLVKRARFQPTTLEGFRVSVALCCVSIRPASIDRSRQARRVSVTPARAPRDRDAAVEWGTIETRINFASGRPCACRCRRRAGQGPETSHICYKCHGIAHEAHQCHPPAPLVLRAVNRGYTACIIICLWCLLAGLK